MTSPGQDSITTVPVVISPNDILIKGNKFYREKELQSPEPLPAKLKACNSAALTCDTPATVQR